jgi:hypothetical protein
VSTSEIIADPAEFTSSWLSEVLAAAGIDAAVKDFSISPVGTGQMASCYRLEMRYDRGEGPARLIAKLPATDPAVRAGSAMTYRTEVGFYRDLAPSLSISTPRSYFARITDDASAFTLLLEDMSPAVTGDQLAGCTPVQAREAAVTVAGLHAGRWCDPTLDDIESLIPRSSSYVELSAPMMPELAKSFLAKRDLDAETTDVLLRFADSYAAWVLGRPQPFSLLHNDYRLDNLLFAPPGAGIPPVTTVDWQSLSIGLPLLDVAFLLGTGLEQSQRRVHERAIVSAYHDALIALGVRDYDAEQCWEDYRYGLFHGPYVCIMGEALAVPTERGLQMFSMMAERSAAAIRELDSFELIRQQE